MAPKEPALVYWSVLATSTALEGADRRRQALARFDADLDKDTRKKRRLCRSCHYLRGGGLALTPQAISVRCRICVGEFQFVSDGSRDPHVICQDCADKHALCCQCAADRELRERRRKWA